MISEAEIEKLLREHGREKARKILIQTHHFMDQTIDMKLTMLDRATAADEADK